MTEPGTIDIEITQYLLRSESLSLVVEQKGLGWAIRLADGDGRQWLQEAIESHDDALDRARRYMALWDEAQKLQEQAAKREHEATMILKGRTEPAVF